MLYNSLLCIYFEVVPVLNVASPDPAARGWYRIVRAAVMIRLWKEGRIPPCLVPCLLPCLLPALCEYDMILWTHATNINHMVKEGTATTVKFRRFLNSISFVLPTIPTIRTTSPNNWFREKVNMKLDNQIPWSRYTKKQHRKKEQNSDNISNSKRLTNPVIQKEFEQKTATPIIAGVRKRPYLYPTHMFCWSCVTNNSIARCTASIQTTQKKWGT